MSDQAGQMPPVAMPRRWDVLASFMLEQKYKTFVEVGCKEGRTTGFILNNVPDSTVIAIDPWMVQTPTTADAETYESWNFATIEAEFWKNVGDGKDRCHMHRGTSKEAEFWYTQGGRKWDGTDILMAPAGFDIVFIDARHDYDSVREDISLWWPLVRQGGMLCGHDFNHQWPGVERAVADSFNLMHVGVASDSVWFIVKQSEEQLRAPQTHAQAKG